MRIHFVAFNGDEASAGVRRANVQLNGFAGRHFRFIQTDLQFGVALERAT